MSTRGWPTAGLTAVVLALAALVGAVALLLGKVATLSDRISEAAVSVTKAGQAIGIGERVKHIQGLELQLNYRHPSPNSFGKVCAQEPDPLMKIVTARVVLFDIFPGSVSTMSDTTITNDGRQACATVAAQDRNDGQNSEFKARLDADAVLR
jgi:hypothetical protein